MLMVAVVFAAMADVMEQEIVVVPEQDQPADAFAETNVTLAGSVSVSTPLVMGAAACPRFCTFME
jgi:lipid-binding SYLF domain-containing protein